MKTKDIKKIVKDNLGWAFLAAATVGLNIYELTNEPPPIMIDVYEPSFEAYYQRMEDFYEKQNRVQNQTPGRELARRAAAIILLLKVAYSAYSVHKSDINTDIATYESEAPKINPPASQTAFQPRGPGRVC